MASGIRKRAVSNENRKITMFQIIESLIGQKDFDLHSE